MFLFSITIDTLWSSLHIIFIPSLILYRSRTNYPEIWSRYQATPIPFFTNLQPQPQRKPRLVGNDIEIQKVPAQYSYFPGRKKISLPSVTI